MQEGWRSHHANDVTGYNFESINMRATTHVVSSFGCALYMLGVCIILGIMYVWCSIRAKSETSMYPALDTSMPQEVTCILKPADQIVISWHGN